MLSRPPGRKHAPGPVGATGSFLKSANTDLRRQTPQAMQEDPIDRPPLSGLVGMLVDRVPLR